MKKTNELLNELFTAPDIDTYIKKNVGEFTSQSLSELLNNLMQKNNVTRAEAVKASGLYEIYAYKILSGERVPSRDKIIAMCIGVKANFDEIQNILKTTKNSQLYIRDKRDSIIIFGIKNRQSVFDINDKLYNNDFEILS